MKCHVRELVISQFDSSKFRSLPNYFLNLVHSHSTCLLQTPAQSFLHSCSSRAKLGWFLATVHLKNTQHNCSDPNLKRPVQYFFEFPNVWRYFLEVELVHLFPFLPNQQLFQHFSRFIAFELAFIFSIKQGCLVIPRNFIWSRQQLTEKGAN